MNFPWWLFVLYLAKGVDLATTELLLSQPGFYEVNPVMQEAFVRYGTFVVAPIVVELYARKLERDGHENRALWVRVSMIALWSFAAGWNLSR